MEKHASGISAYVKDIVYGANDGIITTFAIVSASFGAGFSSTVIIVLGIANLLADGFSMAASNFLGSRSENDLFRREKKRESDEVEEVPEKEKQEIREIFQHHNFSADYSEKLVELVSSNKEFWVDFMMRYELGMNVPEKGSEWKSASLTFMSFVFAGSLPLLPFILFNVGDATFAYSITATASALFIVGAARYFITGVNWIISGLEMLLVGGIAVGASYLVGYLIGAIIA
ncbi:MAG: VIT1/CCC1 transporter family protein [Candidatus Liptonbacteria bacterium]|nr:VIT1/CCC1 transporter family protein [Candidatus Liptonbacteria bacterium]